MCAPCEARAPITRSEPSFSFTLAIRTPQSAIVLRVVPQRSGHSGGERLERNWLVEELRRLALFELHLVGRVAGHEQEAHAGVLDGEPHGQLATTHSLQHDVGEDEIGRRAGARDQCQRRISVRGLSHAITELLEQTPDGRPNLRVVIDEEDGWAASKPLRSDRRFRATGLGRLTWACWSWLGSRHGRGLRGRQCLMCLGLDVRGRTAVTGHEAFHEKDLILVKRRTYYLSSRWWGVAELAKHRTV